MSDASIRAEQALLGACLIDAAAFAKITPKLTPDNFARPDHQAIFAAISALAANGSPTDCVTVAAELEREGRLTDAGGIAYLSQVARETPTAANVSIYADYVREHRPRINGAAQGDAPAIVLRHVADIVEERRETEWLKGLHKILERRVIAILAGFRDTLKSFIATHWAMTAALSGESVVILSGEGGGLGRRIEAWMKEFAPVRTLRDLKIVALEHPVRLNALAVMCELIAAIDAAGIIPALIVIDTLSKFTPGMKENASEEVAAFLHLLSTLLRDHYGCTVLIVAHAGHADVKRPRGSSVLMANPDAEYVAEKPDPKALNVIVSRDRFKDSPAMPPLAYTAKVVDLGRKDKHDEAITSLVLWEATAGAVIASKPAVKGKARLSILAEVRKLGDAVLTSEELRKIGRDLGLHKNSARDAVDFLTASGHLIPAGAGAWKLAP